MEFIPENQNTFESVANVTMTIEDSQKIASTIPKNVITPKEYMTADFVEIRTDSLVQIYELLTEAEKSKWPIGEVLLGISTCCIGGILSALCSKIALTTLLGKVTYIVLPMIAVGTMVAYCFTRHNQLADTHDLSKQIKKLLPAKEEIINEH